MPAMLRSGFLAFALLLFPVSDSHAFAPGDSHGLAVKGINAVDQRTFDITLKSRHLVQNATVRIVLPEGYNNDPERRYPVLYLLHGGGGTHVDWTHLGANDSVGDAPVILVQPSGGKGSWYMDASVAGLDGRPQWETYIITELLPWVDAQLRTIGHRYGRAIAGLSMGGYGTMSYAARHPDLFAAASAYSGAVDTRGELVANWIGVSPIIDVRMPYSIFGPWPLDQKRRLAHNPYSLAHQLRGIRIALYFGNGRAGPLDDKGGFNPPGEFMDWIQEAEVHKMNVALHERLEQLGIAHDYLPYGDGQHTGGYWQRSFAEDFPAILAVLEQPWPAQNLLDHGDFERGDVSPWRCEGRCWIVPLRGTPHSGRGHARLGEQAGWSRLTQSVTLAPNTRYHLTGWVRTQGRQRQGLFGVRDGGGTVLGQARFAQLPDYTQLTVTFRTGSRGDVQVFTGLDADDARVSMDLDDVALHVGWPEDYPAPPAEIEPQPEQPMEPQPEQPDDTVPTTAARSGSSNGAGSLWLGLLMGLALLRHRRS